MISFLQWLKAIFIVLAMLMLRFVLILPQLVTRPRAKRSRGSPCYMMIVLGSGGHTAEMLQLLRHLDTTSYTHRRYVISAGDTFSANRAAEFESMLAKLAVGRQSYGSFDVCRVTRARQIHQSLLTTPFTSLRCIWDCFQVLFSTPTGPSSSATFSSSFPDIIVTNGPATATIMIFASLVLRYLGIRGSGTRMRCVYIESWARVRRLSLSGRILHDIGACDRFLVQWRSLSGRGAEFRGQLVA